MCVVSYLELQRVANYFLHSLFAMQTLHRQGFKIRLQTKLQNVLLVLSRVKILLLRQTFPYIRAFPETTKT